MRANGHRIHAAVRPPPLPSSACGLVQGWGAVEVEVAPELPPPPCFVHLRGPRNRTLLEWRDAELT